MGNVGITMLDMSANFGRIVAIIAIAMVMMTALFVIEDEASLTAVLAPLGALLAVAFAFLFAKNGQDAVVKQIENKATDRVEYVAQTAVQEVKQEAVQVAAELVENATTKKAIDVQSQDKVFVKEDTDDA